MRVTRLTALVAVALIGTVVALDDVSLVGRLALAGAAGTVVALTLRQPDGGGGRGDRRVVASRAEIIDLLTGEMSRSARTGQLVAIVVVAGMRRSLLPDFARLRDRTRRHDVLRWDRTRNELVAVAVVPHQSAAHTYARRVAGEFPGLRVEAAVEDGPTDTPADLLRRLAASAAAPVTSPGTMA